MEYAETEFISVLNPGYLASTNRIDKSLIHGSVSLFFLDTVNAVMIQFSRLRNTGHYQLLYNRISFAEHLRFSTS